MVKCQGIQDRTRSQGAHVEIIWATCHIKGVRMSQPIQEPQHKPTQRGSENGRAKEGYTISLVYGSSEDKR
jgi:hypothetical protein